jgi:hypothetical protein
MLVVNETSTTVTSDILIAVSNDDNPADGFTEMQRIHINNTDLFDYPKVGFNADAVVIMTNVYDGTSGNFVDVQLVTIQKSTILDENPATFTDYLTTADGTNFNLWPAEMHGAAPGAPMLFVTEDGANQGAEMRVVSMTNELSNSPTVVDTNIPVTPYDPTPEPLDPGGPITAKIDGRTLSADWRNNMLLTTQDVGTTASSGAIGKTRFYEFNTSGTPALVQEGEIDQGQNDFTYEGAIAQDQNGNLAMTFLQSSSTQFMSMYVTAQSAGAPAGTMDAPTEVAAGQADEFGDTDAGGRVGDYAAAVLDPVDGSFWLANEYATADGFWGTLITHISVAPPATIKGHVFADVNDDATDDPGDPGLKGVKLYLDLNHDNIFDPATDPTAVTNSNGNFTFANLPPGRCKQRFRRTLQLPLAKQLVELKLACLAMARSVAKPISMPTAMAFSMGRKRAKQACRFCLRTLRRTLLSAHNLPPPTGHIPSKTCRPALTASLRFQGPASSRLAPARPPFLLSPAITRLPTHNFLILISATSRPRA